MNSTDHKAVPPITVLIADDSPFICRLLAAYLNSEPGFAVIGMVHNGKAAVEKVKTLRPDAVTLDLEMPDMDGLEALTNIMRETPVPVVVISGVSGRSATRTLQALDLGAVDFVLKYAPGMPIDPEQLRLEVRAKVRAAAGIRVVRLLGASKGESGEIKRKKSKRVEPGAAQTPACQGLVVIGASTGGPSALRELLAQLPESFDAGIVIVQHIPKNFTGVLAAQLHRYSKLDVREAEDGDLLRPGQVLVAPGGYHLVIRSGLRVGVVAGQEGGGHCPSIDVTMQSAAQVMGSRVRGVVLTGMGDDGTAGLRAIHRRGGATFAQDAESCVINGMPQRAIDAGVVDHVAPPAAIAALLSSAHKQARRQLRKELDHAALSA